MSVRKNQSQSKRKKSGTSKRFARKSASMTMDQRKEQFIRQNHSSLVEDKNLFDKVVDVMLTEKRTSSSDERAERQNDTLLNALLNRELDRGTIEQEQFVKIQAELKSLERDKRELKASLMDAEDRATHETKKFIATAGFLTLSLLALGVGAIYGYKTGKGIDTDDTRNFAEFWSDELEYMAYEINQKFDDNLKLPNHRFGDPVDDAYVEAKIELNKV
ncbi:MAG: hypothetical protein HeimC2_40410 [Candidatus Heimdallarchaeota archaeon LC_2]|nr:MAG: hypothetical protein HeimC2_40410 [Candidatus Heimdallarchaeota archaeon LC_2]